MNSLMGGFGEHQDAHVPDELLTTARSILAASSKASNWALEISPPWAHLSNRSIQLPLQGWKIHVSSTPNFSVKVIEKLLPLLFEEDCCFKFAATKDLLRNISRARIARGTSGKFLTVYPRDEKAAVRIADICYRETQGLPGPRILSDRAYRDDGVVFYRYGAFSSEQVFTDDGLLEYVIRDPQGRPVVDQRSPWYVCPPWVEDPFEAACTASRTSVKPESEHIVLNDRYRVFGAIRHANKGGVYKAFDEVTGEDVVIKEARPYVDFDASDRDARDWLRNEFHNLRHLEHLSLTPRARDLFTKEEHVFLVVDHIEGGTLRRRIQERRDSARRPLPWGEVVSLITRCAAIIAACHQAGFLILDFTPNNLMLARDHRLLLIDLELGCLLGTSTPPTAGTPGYISPEQLRSEKPSVTDDYFSLGAVCFFIATMQDPFLPADEPLVRTNLSRISEWLEPMVHDGLVQQQVAELILGCLAPEPSERWNPERVVKHCQEVSAVRRTTSAGPYIQSKLECMDLQEVVRGIAQFTIESIDLSNKDRPVRVSCLGQRTDPCGIQHGAAGVGGFLLASLPLLENDREGAKEKVMGLARWSLDVIGREYDRPRPVGLYYGSAGAAWFTLDLALAFEDQRLAQEVCEVVLSFNLKDSNCDVTHGVAGLGMTFLHFYRKTLREDFLDRAIEAADLIVDVSRDEGIGISWLRKSHGEDLNPLVSYGFAHGNAGIAYFLLAAFGATGDVRYLDSARRGLEFVIGAADFDGDSVYWAHGPGRPARWPYWCNGSSGVGTALIRAYLVTKETRYRDLAITAARTVIENRHNGNVGQCHGLAGNGEFLLDMAKILSDDSFVDGAWKLADSIWLKRVYRHNRPLFVDDTGVGIVPDFAIGVTGVGWHYLRLAQGGCRPFMVDDFIRAI